MSRCPLALVLAAAAIAPVLLAGQQPAPAPSQETPTFRALAEAVQVSVVVTDESGRPVSGLSEDDFEITEGGRPAAITTFSAIDIPFERTEAVERESDVLSNDGPPGRVYVIAFDDMSATNALRSRHFLRGFIDRYFGPNDSAAVTLTTRGLTGTGQDFTRSRRLLVESVDRFTGGSTADSLWMREKNFMGSFLSLVKVMTTMPVARKTLILVSRNIPGDADLVRSARTSRIGRMFSEVNPEFLEAISLATRNNIVVYPIDPAGLTTETTEAGSFNTTAMEQRASLDALAEITGGFALSNSNNYDMAFERLVRESSTYYVLGFNSGAGDNRRFAPVNVRVRRSGLQVRTVEGYVPEFKKPDEVRRPSTVLAAAWDAVASPLTSSGVNLRLTAMPYKASGKTGNVAVALEVAIDKLGLVERDGSYHGDLELLFAVTDAKTRRRYPIIRHRATLALKPDTYERINERALRVLSELTLPEGRYQLRVSAGGQTVAGSVVYDVEVPNFRDDFAMSGIALTSADARRTVTVSPPGKMVVPFPGPPTTAREFSRDDVLTLFAETYENRRKPHRVTFSLALRDGGGRILDRLELARDSDEKPAGASTYAFSPSLSLADVSPGSYVLEVAAGSSLDRKVVTRSISIAVR
jgi:VWFA-related protein